VLLSACKDIAEALAPSSTAVVWFRDHCLRTLDNEALGASVASGVTSAVVPVFLWPSHGGSKAVVNPATGGTAKDVFVAHALDQLNATLDGSLRIGFVVDDSPSAIAAELKSICRSVEADTVYYPLSHSKKMEDKLHWELAKCGVQSKAFGTSFSLLDYTDDEDVSVPWKDIILSHSFRSPLIPFVNWLLGKLDKCPPRKPLPRPVALDKKLRAVPTDANVGLSSPVTAKALLDSIGISPGGYDWGRSIAKAWPASEGDAMDNLGSFLASVAQSDDLSDDTTEEASESLPAKRTHLASRLSPYLARGILSPQQVYDALLTQLDSVDTASFVRRLCWRDYTYAVTALFPDIEEGKPIRGEYYSETFNEEHLDAETRRRFDLWKKGCTGFPLVDAGMRN